MPNIIMYRLVTHFGGGSWALTPEEEQQYIEKIRLLLTIGHTMLKKGYTALDTVQKIVELMEDSGYYNCGKGSITNYNGVVEMDAGIMCGKTLRGGAVATVRTIKNPIKLARLVMDKTHHRLLACEGADEFGKKKGLETVSDSYFVRYQPVETSYFGKAPHETVGAIALDKYGDLAVASSTGGIDDKLKGRIGGVPQLGLELYANNKTCAVACTGIGEPFMRLVTAYDISAQMQYGGKSLEEAVKNIFKEKVEGGLIAMDKDGNIVKECNAPEMLYGYIKEDGSPFAEMYKTPLKN